jgi:hypothetical protein
MGADAEKHGSSRDAEKRKAEEAAREKDCRCKETAAMSPSQLLKLMISALSFWKKGNKK